MSTEPRDAEAREMLKQCRALNAKLLKACKAARGDFGEPGRRDAFGFLNAAIAEAEKTK